MLFWIGVIAVLFGEYGWACVFFILHVLAE